MFTRSSFTRTDVSLLARNLSGTCEPPLVACSWLCVLPPFSDAACAGAVAVCDVLLRGRLRQRLCPPAAESRCDFFGPAKTLVHFSPPPPSSCRPRVRITPTQAVLCFCKRSAERGWQVSHVFPLHRADPGYPLLFVRATRCPHPHAGVAVQRTAAQMRSVGFRDVRMFEILSRNMDCAPCEATAAILDEDGCGSTPKQAHPIKRLREAAQSSASGAVSIVSRPPKEEPGHTGYLLFGTLCLPPLEDKQQ